MAPASSSTDIASRQQRRGFWLRTLHHWHWISSAICLVGMLVFAATGITLNHSAAIEAKPVVINETAQVPASVLRALGKREEGNAPLPGTVSAWLNDELAVSIGSQAAEWSADEIYLSLPRPGGDAWLSIDRSSGAVEYESTSRGAIAYLNDLHKGRNAGAAWRWFIDVFAVACLVFCITGLFLLQMHARQRRMTWPYVGLGLVLPVLLVLIFIH
ncbi:PepSY-associated TM helix domain-containing protein [Lysobacter cavernae]|uniref:PepSY-associated TM helix domain-containing protein n=1 Tax=Lysobacter cavernae TaxID=1685901 RepID=A0ABV7RLC6_9GAMM